MKIAVYLGRTPPEGGGGFTFEESVLSALIEQRSEMNHEFVALASGKDLLERAASEGFETYRLPSSVLGRALLRTPSPPLFQARASIARRRPIFRERLAVRLGKLGVRLIWSVGPEIPGYGLPFIVTVWDLQHRLQPFFPEVSALGVWEERERYYSKVLPRAALVVTGTKVGAEEVNAFYRVPHSRIAVVPHPTPSFALSGRGKGSDRILGGESYVVYPAQFWPHKNHIVILRALHCINQSDGRRYSCVFVGSDWGSNREHVWAAAQELGVEDQVQFLGFVPRQKLVEIYRGAHALVYPSFFGPENLPPLEAFALGCPVIAADAAGSSEQLGDAALLFDPLDHETLARHIVALGEDDSLRERLLAKGVFRARRSTPTTFVRRMFEEIDRLSLIFGNWTI